MNQSQLKYDVAEFIIHNKAEIASTISGPLLKYWDLEPHFPPPFRRMFTESVALAVVECVREYVADIMLYDLSAEQGLELITEELLQQLTDNYFFDKSTYLDLAKASPPLLP